MMIIIVCLLTAVSSELHLIAGSGLITALCGCDDAHYGLNITTVSRSAWGGLLGVTASGAEGSDT